METKGLSTGGAADPQWHHVARLVGFGAVDGSCRGPVGPQSDGPRVKELCRDGDHVPKPVSHLFGTKNICFSLQKAGLKEVLDLMSEPGEDLFRPLTLGRAAAAARRALHQVGASQPSGRGASAGAFRTAATTGGAAAGGLGAHGDALHVHAGGAEGRGDRQHRPGLRAAPPGPGWGPLAGGEAFLASSARTSGREGPAVGVVVGSGADAAP